MSPVIISRVNPSRTSAVEARGKRSYLYDGIASRMSDEQRQQGAGEEVEFQTLSPLAAISLLLALASPAALAAPVFLCIPLAAALVALLALTKIRDADGALTGARMARWSVAIALACVAATLVRGPVRDALMRRQARAVGQQWLTYIAEGRVSEALDLMTLSAVQALGPKPVSPDAEPPKPEDVRTIALEKLRTDKVALRLAEAEAPLRFQATPAPGDWPVFEAGRILRMEDFTASSDQGGRAVRVQVRFARTKYYEDEGQPWRVDTWQVIDDAAASPSSGAAANSSSSALNLRAGLHGALSGMSTPAPANGTFRPG
jgi:hypothetical protein